VPLATILEPTHGDFHEGQLLVAGGAISGVLDIDTVGPGRRVDDLACLLGHLSSIQRMNADQAARVSRLVGGWLPVFDRRVDPAELRLRAAAVIISLATGPYRGQEPDWQRETLTMINTATELLRSLRR
jgi:Ser/Thr protein kinase RdoA (MazF antagonist)